MMAAQAAAAAAQQQQQQQQQMSSSANNNNNTTSSSNQALKMEHLVAALQDPETRENALLDISKRRDLFVDLAPVLWHSYGVVPALLQEIVSIYPLLSPPSLTNHASNRVCNALALLQCVASHPDTRAQFLNAHVPSVLVPVFEHGEQNETVRVFTVDVVRGDRRVGESGRHGGD